MTSPAHTGSANETIKILLVTGGRADWGLLTSPAMALQAHPNCKLIVVATGTHVDARFGDTAQEIQNDGLPIHYKLPILKDLTTSSRDLTQALANVTTGIGDILSIEAPDLVLVLGDRYEILGAVNAAMMARIPIAHICGGDITEGAIDDAIRHAISKMSHIHFTTNPLSSKRLALMGENPDHIHCVGNPGLDTIPNQFTYTAASFKAAFGLQAERPLGIVTYHPTTLDNTPPEMQIKALLNALTAYQDKASFIITGSNADHDGVHLSDILSNYASQHPHCIFKLSLGHKLYFEALNAADFALGNSSSGLYEVPSFKIPTINIGDRQKGRLRGNSVIDTPAETQAIIHALKQAMILDRTLISNPYSTGNAGERIANILTSLTDVRALLHKTFIER